jgi:hypothetical protein
MRSNRIKSTTVEAGRPRVKSREAAARRGLQASRGAPAGARLSWPPRAPAKSTDRLGTAFTLLLGLALVAGGSLMVGQIWANLAMIR